MDNLKIDVAVVIGRFQPFHIGHEAMVKHALAIAPHVVVVVGGYASGASDKNPYGFYQRSEMISRTMKSERLTVIPARDMNSDHVWKAHIERDVKSAYDELGLAKESYNVVLVGHEKDESSYYLKLFEDWQFIPAPVFTTEKGNVLSATDIREGMLNWNSKMKCGEPVKSVLPYGTISTLLDAEKYGAIPYSLVGDSVEIVDYKYELE